MHFLSRGVFRLLGPAVWSTENSYHLGSHYAWSNNASQVQGLLPGNSLLKCFFFFSCCRKLPLVSPIGLYTFLRGLRRAYQRKGLHQRGGSQPEKKKDLETSYGSVDQNASSETQGQFVGTIELSPRRHEHSIVPTNCPWVSEGDKMRFPFISFETSCKKSNSFQYVWRGACVKGGL